MLTEVEPFLSPYEVVLQKVKEGTINPYDIDIDYLIEIFRGHAKDLQSSDYLKEAGRFLEASARLMKLQVEDIFPKPKVERKRITIKEVREVLEVTEGETEYDLSFLWEYTPKVGRPRGAKDKGRRLSWKEFWKEAREGVPLHKEINYNEVAKRLRERYLKTGRIEIRSLTDFIAYLFAFYEFDDIPDIIYSG